MSLRYIFGDVVREYIRSRMIYSFLILTAVVVGLVVNIALIEMDRTNARKFEDLVAAARNKSALEQRLRTAAQVPFALDRCDLVWPDNNPLPRPTNQRLVYEETPWGGQLCVMEIPEATLGMAALYARGGLLDETEEQLGITNYLIKLMNQYLTENPHTQPLLEVPAAYNEDGIWLEADFLPDYLPAAVRSLVDVALNPQLDPQLNAHFILGTLQEISVRRKSDPEAMALQTTLDNLAPRHRFAKSYIGERSALITFKVEMLAAWLTNLYTPRRVGLLIAGPFRVQDVRQLLETMMQPFGDRQVNPPPANFPAPKANVGINQRTCGKSDRVTVAGGLRIDYPVGVKADLRLAELISNLYSLWVMDLRDRGLIYGGRLLGPLFIGDSTIFVGTFTSSKEKELRLVSEVETWLRDYPAGIDDAALKSCLNAIVRACRARSNDALELGQHLLTGYLLRGIAPMGPEIELAAWKKLSLQDLRFILSPCGSERSVVITSMRPGKFDL